METCLKHNVQHCLFLCQKVAETEFFLLKNKIHMLLAFMLSSIIEQQLHSGPKLEFLRINQTLLPFVKIKQSFILMQST